MVYLHACVLSCFSNVWLFVTLQTVACQSPLSMGFCRQVYWSGLPPPLPWYVYYTTNQGNNYHQLLNFARAIARAHYSHKTLLSLGNFQWVQKTVRRKLFQNNQGIVYRWEYRALRENVLPNSCIHSSIQLSGTKHKAKWTLAFHYCFLFGESNFSLIGQEKSPPSWLLLDASFY